MMTSAIGGVLEQPACLHVLDGDVIAVDGFLTACGAFLVAALLNLDICARTVQIEGKVPLRALRL
jgi:hypothetical protein